MKDDQKQRHQQTITNTTNKNTDKLTRAMKKKKLKYLLHKKIQSLKMIEKGTCCQEGKRQEKSRNFPSLLEGEWEKFALQ